MRNNLIILGLFFAFLIAPLCARSQTVGLHTNALGWAAATPNIGLEIGFAKKWSVEVDGAYNPFTFKNGRKTNLWSVQPEVKFWPRYKFAGHYLGVHGHYAMYDWGLWKYRYKGDLGGLGISYGYAWMIHKRWNIEGTVGFGWSKLNYDNKYDRRDSQICYGPSSHGYWGISKIGIKVTYFLK